MRPLQAVVLNPSRARALAAGCIALAAGSVVLMRAPHGSPRPPAPPRVAAVTPVVPASRPAPTPPASPHVAAGPTRVDFAGPNMHGSLGVAQSVLRAHGTRTLLAELRVAADESPSVERLPWASARPVAMAVVLDTSGSMEGEKIEQARQAVLALVDRMRAFDRIALVTYSDGARVVQPLAPVSEVRERLHRVLPTVRASGGTMIPLGLATGAGALADAPAGSVRRIVLLSDGQDTSGTPLPTLRNQVEQRAREGATLSALGIGVDYDERFLTAIADAGHGNYEFLREPGQLRGFLARELEQAASTTVENAVAEVRLPTGFRLVRAYGAESEPTAGGARIALGSLFRGDERRVVLELAVDAGAQGTLGALGVTLAYRAAGRDARSPGGSLWLAAADAQSDVDGSRNAALSADAQATAIAARQSDAVAQWRSGDGSGAGAIVEQNIHDLTTLNERVQSSAIAAQIAEYRRDQATFGNTSAETEEGRAYGLNANAVNRARQLRAPGR